MKRKSVRVIIPYDLDSMSPHPVDRSRGFMEQVKGAFGPGQSTSYISHRWRDLKWVLRPAGSHYVSRTPAGALWLLMNAPAGSTVTERC